MTEPDRRAAALGMALLGGGLAIGACGSRAAPGQAAASGRVRADLYNCEGCEASEERAPEGMPSRVQLASAQEPGERLLLTGRVLATDGATPVKGVVVYAHHTNADGLYATGSPDRLWSRRHGGLRGWARSDETGRYAFDTIKPAPYPDMTIPAHIHLYIKEADRRPYYIDDVVFEGEFGVTDAYRARSEMRGGDGVVRLGRRSDGSWTAERDIRLERHPV